MINYFNYKNKDSRDYGILIRNKQTFDAPKRDIDFVSVPGRDGDLLIDNGRYPNVDMTYGIMLVAPSINPLNPNENIDLAEASKAVRQWLMSNYNYYQLIDSYDPDYFRLAVFSGDIKLETKNTSIAYSDIKFNCKPYRYRIDGQKNLTTNASALTLFNPESLFSLPRITVKGNGTLTITVNSVTYTVTNVVNSVIIDSEMMNIYNPNQSTNYNRYASFSTFPKLKSGTNTITPGTNVTGIDIIPRWRCM